MRLALKRHVVFLCPSWGNTHGSAKRIRSPPLLCPRLSGPCVVCPPRATQRGPNWVAVSSIIDSARWTCCAVLYAGTRRRAVIMTGCPLSCMRARRASLFFIRSPTCAGHVDCASTSKRIASAYTGSVLYNSPRCGNEICFNHTVEREPRIRTGLRNRST